MAEDSESTGFAGNPKHQARSPKQSGSRGPIRWGRAGDTEEGAVLITTEVGCRSIQRCWATPPHRWTRGYVASVVERQPWLGAGPWERLQPWRSGAATISCSDRDWSRSHGLPVRCGVWTADCETV